MNGNTVPFLVWVINGLFAVVSILIGAIIRMHQKSDEEHRERMDKEINGLRTRMHELGNKLSEVQAKVILK